MSIVIVKKAEGGMASGAEIAEESHIREGREYNDMYPQRDFWGGQFVTRTVDKLGYVCAALSTLSRTALGRRRKQKAAKLLLRADNLTRRMANYVPHCTGVRYYENWRWRGLPARQKPFHARWDYGRVDRCDAGFLLEFLKAEGISDFDFVADSRYVIVVEWPGGMWEDMKRTGLVKAAAVASEHPSSAC